MGGCSQPKLANRNSCAALQRAAQGHTASKSSGSGRWFAVALSDLTRQARRTGDLQFSALFMATNSCVGRCAFAVGGALLQRCHSLVVLETRLTYKLEHSRSGKGFRV